MKREKKNEKQKRFAANSGKFNNFLHVVVLCSILIFLISYIINYLVIINTKILF